MNKKIDTRRDAWNRDYMPADYYKEFEEACKIEPKKDYTIWVFAFFFISVLVLVGSTQWNYLKEMIQGHIGK